MPKYHITVRSMTAVYRGQQEGDDEADAIEKLRQHYRRTRDNRSTWEMHARPWTDKDDDAQDPYADHED